MKNNKNKIFIEALEQRIMLDGAGASTALDIIDERSKDKLINKNTQKISKLSENKIEDNSQKLPFDQIVRDQKRNDRKQVVFIDSQVQDYQTLIDAFNEDTEVYLIQSNEDGFKKIDKVLKNDADISSLHIIGHGSAGKILFGNATLSNDTIQSYNHTLRSIGQSLTEDGDILFYGCNVTSTEGGKTLISKISEVTKADIAASDDVTGKSGDWKLESKVGNIETKNISQVNYIHDLAMTRTANRNSFNDKVDINLDGITHIRGAMAAFTGTTDRNAFDFTTSKEHNDDNTELNYMSYISEGNFGTGSAGTANQVERIAVVLEKTGITSGSLTALQPDYGAGTQHNGRNESQWASSYQRTIGTSSSAYYQLSSTATASDSDTGPMDVYMIFLDSRFNNASDRHNKIGEVKFDRKIIGLLKDKNDLSNNTVGTIDLHNPNNSTYPNTSSSASDTRGFETLRWRAFQGTESTYRGYGNSSSSKDGDWVAVDHSDLRTINFGMKNIGGGDLMRVLVEGNSPPVAQNDEGVVNEDGTLTVANSSNANVTDSYDAHQEHSGDLMDTSSASNSDSDPNTSEYGDTIKITAIQHSSAGSSTAVGDYTYDHGSATSVTGTYGTLTIGSDGSYEYVADQDAADALDSGDEVNDVFTYTITDQHPGYDFAYSGTATATLTIKVLGINDPTTAQNDEGVIVEGGTLTVSNGDNANQTGDIDATGEHSGDVINTSSSSHADSDADADANLTITGIRTGGAGGGTAGSVGTALDGTYGQLTISADGSYTYVANKDAANALDTGDSATDVFTYTLSDGGSGTDTATITITILGENDTPTAGNETVYINENNTDATHGARTSLNIRKDFAASDFTNYSDPDDDLGIKIKSLPSSGTLTKLSSGSYVAQSVNDTITDITKLRYTPDANSESDDSFTYKAYDGTTVGGNTRTITISVNAAPVAVNDTGSITAGDDDATGNVLTNDTDSDDAASALAIRGVGAGAESSTLANSNVGSAVSGTYGDLTINSGGAYTYSVTGNAATNALRAGETATDVFSYKVMDDETNAGSKAIDIGTITFTITGVDGDATGEPNPDEVVKPKKEKKEVKKQKREEDRQLKKLKREKRLERKELKIAKSKLAKRAEFNQGLRLVDLVAESKSFELKDKDNDIYIDKIVAKHSDKALKVKFKVFNDEGKDVQKYYGVMKDGSPLPDWIKINPKTGKTKTDIPKGMKMVEFKIIAVDVDNNKKQVTVVIDSKKIAEDKEILKQARKIERANKLEVENDGSIKFNSLNESGQIDKTKTDSINNIDSFEDFVKTIEPDEFLNFDTQIKDDNFEFELPWEDKIKFVSKDGKEIPEWIKYDPKSGKVIASPPENVKSIDLKVILEDSNGEISVKDIKLNFENNNTQESQKIIDNETKFVSLSSQLSKEYSNWDSYGSQLIDRL